ncbi:MAG: hypothetical protein OEW39_03110 [Deltaproteobacteria bacterium]|nr:hypothetical protein [Deltaproteobacteria bacterium]
MEIQKNVAENTIRINYPANAIPKKFHEPILYLAERMAMTGAPEEPHATRVVDQLAALVGITQIRKQRFYRELNERKACEKLDIDSAKIAALVVLTLVLKMDTNRGDAPKAFFSRMRKLLKCDPIAAPADIEEHKAIAIKYLAG